MKFLRHKACASEFDYQGWKVFGTWRREVLRAVAERESENEEVEGKDGRGDGDVLMPLLAPTVPRPGQWFCGAWAKKPASLKAKRDFWAKDCWSQTSVE